MKYTTQHVIRLVLIQLILSTGLFITTTGWAKGYTFSWSPNNAGVEGYRLYYKKGGTAAAPFNGTDAVEGPSPIDICNGNSVTINGLEDNTTYHFTLTAFSGSEESDFTPVITVFPQETTNRLRAMHLVYRILLEDSL